MQLGDSTGIAKLLWSLCKGTRLPLQRAYTCMTKPKKKNIYIYNLFNMSNGVSWKITHIYKILLCTSYLVIEKKLHLGLSLFERCAHQETCTTNKDRCEHVNPAVWMASHFKLECQAWEHSYHTHTHTHTYPRVCRETQQSVAEVQSGPTAVTLFTVKIWGIQSPCILAFKAPLDRNVHITHNSQRECLWIGKNCCDTANKTAFCQTNFRVHSRFKEVCWEELFCQPH